METVVKWTNGFSLGKSDVSNGSIGRKMDALAVKWTHFLIKWTPYERQVDLTSAGLDARKHGWKKITHSQ